MNHSTFIRLITAGAIGVISTVAPAQPEGGRPEPPQFQAPTYIDKPIWMRYEEAPEEPIEEVQRRLARYATEQSFDVDTLRWNGAEAIDIVVMGDGYTADEQQKFNEDVRKCTDHLFECSPFDRYRNFFNVFAIHVVSKESGVSHPGQWREQEGGGAMVCPENKPMPIERRNTFFNAHLDGWGVHRLMGAWNQQTAKDLVRVMFPRCKVPFILSNSDEYGGAGGDVLIATCNKASSEIYVHELAHGFADLADEYFGGDIYMGEKPNLTATSDEDKVRWKQWLDEPEVGVFPHKGGRLGSRYFKPTQASDSSRYCKMERLGKEFCPVCRERLVEAIHERVRFIVTTLPADTILAPLGRKQQITFSLQQTLEPQDDHLQVSWLLDGEPIARDTRSVTLSGKQLPSDRTHELRIEVFDECPYVRNEACRRFHTQSHTWHIAARY